MNDLSRVVILDPRAGPGIPVTPYDLAANLGKPGLRITLISNGFYDATNLLNAIKERLLTELPSAVITLHDRRDPSSPATPEFIQQIARETDVAITALGHCGSCTASATRDAAALARAGIPACALISEKFIEAASFVARAAGLPDIPRIKLPYPVAGTGKERIAEIAAAAIPSILHSWQGQNAFVAA